MRFVKTAQGKQALRIGRAEWQAIGRQAKWLNLAADLPGYRLDEQGRMTQDTLAGRFAVYPEHCFVPADEILRHANNAIANGEASSDFTAPLELTGRPTDHAVLDAAVSILEDAGHFTFKSPGADVVPPSREYSENEAIHDIGDYERGGLERPDLP
jgi:hypothetical protein